jgi:hypothetical protein
MLDIRNLRISWTALLCRLMHNLYMCGSVQDNSKCSHVSGYIIRHGNFWCWFCGKFGNCGEVFWLLFMGYGVLFHLGCLWTLTFSGVGGGALCRVGLCLSLW